MKVFKSLVTLLLALAMVCECGVNALAAGVGSPVSAPTHTHTGGTATCTERAICDLCHERYGELLPHTPEEIPAVAATCTEPGLTAGVKCAVCGEILAAQAFENLKGAAEALDGWDSLGGDNQAEALKGVREKLETLQKDCDALSFQNLTEEENAALKEKMEAALAALNDFLEGKEGSLSPEALKETLESLMGDVDDYWYSLEKQDLLKTLAKLQAMPTAELHDYLKDTFGTGLTDSGVEKARSRAREANMRPTRSRT